jgi:hypothetical protein
LLNPANSWFAAVNRNRPSNVRWLYVPTLRIRAGLPLTTCTIPLLTLMLPPAFTHRLVSKLVPSK